MTDEIIRARILTALNGRTSINPMSRQELREAIGRGCGDRRMRKLIETMPEIGSSTNPGGYYLIRSKDDCDRAISEHMSRITKHYEHIRRIKARFGGGVPVLPWKVVPSDYIKIPNIPKPNFL